MVAFNTAYAPSKTSTRSKNRVGDFFWQGADCVGVNRLSTRKRIGENRLYSYELASGVTDYGFRYYDPVTGRWPSRDPMGNNWSTGEINEYAFILNSAVVYVDLLGLQISEHADRVVDKHYRKAFRVKHSSTGNLHRTKGGKELIDEFLDSVDDEDEPEEPATCDYSGRLRRSEGCKTRCVYQCSWGSTNVDVDEPFDPNPCDDSIGDPRG